MRFRRDSDEQACGADIYDPKFVSLACLRTAGHKGVHIALAGDAARADGVCFGCRAPIDGPHREDCFGGNKPAE